MGKIKFVISLFTLIIMVVLLFNGCTKKDTDMQTKFKEFVAKYESKVIPLYEAGQFREDRFSRSHGICIVDLRRPSG